MNAQRKSVCLITCNNNVKKDDHEALPSCDMFPLCHAGRSLWAELGRFPWEIIKVGLPWRSRG